MVIEMNLKFFINWCSLLQSIEEIVIVIVLKNQSRISSEEVSKFMIAE